MYLGFLYLEHTYNNPVANTFVALLTDRQEEEEKNNKLALNGDFRSFAKSSYQGWIQEYGSNARIRVTQHSLTRIQLAHTHTHTQKYIRVPYTPAKPPLGWASTESANPWIHPWIYCIIESKACVTYCDALCAKGAVSNKQRVRNRWLVAYTLLNNPSIRQFRASQLHHSRGVEGEGSVEEDRPMNEYEIVVTLPGIN